MVATSMPGNFKSMAYICLPLTLSAVPSIRLTDLPMTFQSLGSFKGTSLGTSNWEAATDTLPKVVLRPDGVCVITLSLATHSDAGTFHWFAAA